MTHAPIIEAYQIAMIVLMVIFMVTIWIDRKNPERTPRERRMLRDAFAFSAVTFAVMMLALNAVIPSLWALLYLLLVALVTFAVSTLRAVRKRDWQSVFSWTGFAMMAIGLGACNLQLTAVQIAFQWTGSALLAVSLVWSGVHGARSVFGTKPTITTPTV